jgi:hypothetical protein
MVEEWEAQNTAKFYQHRFDYQGVCEPPQNPHCSNTAEQLLPSPLPSPSHHPSSLANGNHPGALGFLQQHEAQQHVGRCSALRLRVLAVNPMCVKGLLLFGSLTSGSTCLPGGRLHAAASVAGSTAGAAAPVGFTGASDSRLQALLLQERK